MKIRTTCLLPALLALTVAFAPASPLNAQPSTRAADPFHWRGHVPSGAVVEIKGVNGPIRAVAGVGPEVSIQANRTGRRNDPDEVEIVVLNHANGLTVCAVYPTPRRRDRPNQCAPGSGGRLSSNNSDVQVDFTITVPEGIRFAARTTNGAISAQGLTTTVEARTTNGGISIDGGRDITARTTNGAITVSDADRVNASTTNGSIQARLRGTGPFGPLRLATTNGSIALTLPAATSAHLEARTSNGTIESDLPVTRQGVLSRRSVSGTIGGGGETIELRTTNGSIRLRSGG